jgi:hypothetical protein
MDAVKYLKLDLRLMKGYLKIYLALPLFFVLFVIMNTPAFALNYLFFFILILSSTPFSLEGVGGSQKLYYSLPAKIESMVMGRYLFLFSAIACVFVIDGIAGAYYQSVGKITVLELVTVFTSASIGSVISFMQYPVFYKFGYEKGRLSSLLIYMVPAFLVFALPSILPEMVSQSSLEKIVIFAGENRYLLIMIVILVLVAAAYGSYKISCGFCKKKEI